MLIIRFDNLQARCYFYSGGINLEISLVIEFRNWQNHCEPKLSLNGEFKVGVSKVEYT